MTHVGDLVAQTIERRGAAITQHLGVRQNELTTAIDRSSTHLRSAIEWRCRTSIGALVDTNAKLGAEITEVIDRLVGSSSSLQDAILAAGSNLVAVELALSDRMDDFRSLLGKVTSEVDRLNQTAGDTLFEASGLAQLIARQKEGLSASVANSSNRTGNSIICSRLAAHRSKRCCAALKIVATTSKG